MRIKSEAELKKLIGNGHAKIRNSVQLPSSDLERNTGHEIKRPYEDQAFNSPVIITVHSFRYRLADPDGLCAKYTIDSIVKSGLLVDDTVKEVKEVRFKQTKIKRPAEEKTVVTLEVWEAG